MEDKKIFSNYLKKLVSIAKHGDAREESYYEALSELFTQFAVNIEKPFVHVTTLPKGTDAGNPDFRLWNGSNQIIGYIEAKKPTDENLNFIENSEQLKRYRAIFPNLILTNFIEFRRYRNGECVETARVARPKVSSGLNTALLLERTDELVDLLIHFMDFSLAKTFTAESLAVELAKRTRFLRDVIEEEVTKETAGGGMLTSFYEAFQTFLIGTLTPNDFADLFAQTITYGLFASRIRAGEGFNRRTAFDNIPHTIGVLRDLFRYISLGSMPEQLTWCVDDIAEVLAVADAPGILNTFYRQGKGRDPIVHFYETFLAQYDPNERERRGVYYTPEPVVSYIVRSLHGLIKTHFNKSDGLASNNLTLLDPAAGTMTFIAKATQLAVDEFTSKYGNGGKKNFIRQNILNNFYAFELMMAPYAVGHLKMGFLLEELGYHLGDNERMPFYLTNSLENEELELSKLPGLSALAEESRLAGIVKKQTPILVILGNPPYTGQSSNVSEWIRTLIEDYKQVDDKPLRERNTKWLQADYVKFMRFAQWKIEQSGYGLIGMITNHGYLDNPTNRGMRQSLLRTFDEIYILNLHGSMLKKEICPDGSPDQNVFDISIGVTIAFYIKHNKEHKDDAIVHYADLWGQREQKYIWLNKNDLTCTNWQDLKPSSPFYQFIPSDVALSSIYQSFISIQEIFPINSAGIVTARDDLTINWSKEELWKTVTSFSHMEPELARQEFDLRRDTRDWKVALAQRDLLDSGPSKEKIVPILYRPFDVRHTYYTGKSRGFICMPRSEVMHHMLAGENLGFITVRRSPTGNDPCYFFVSKNIISNGSIRSDNISIDTFFPLYLYPSTNHEDLFSQIEPQIRQSNINSELVKTLEEAYNKKISPEEIFNYIYAIVYANSYRLKYSEFLRMEFPRVPFTEDSKLFEQLTTLGARLTDLHLLQSIELETPDCRFEGQGDCHVGRGDQDGLYYDPEKECVYINAHQYFMPVIAQVWEYQIGSYQICEKWLKDRRNRRLDLNDIQTYCRIITALRKTIEIQNAIDELYPKVEEGVIDFSK